MEAGNENEARRKTAVKIVRICTSRCRDASADVPFVRKQAEPATGLLMQLPHGRLLFFFVGVLILADLRQLQRFYASYFKISAALGTR